MPAIEFGGLNGTPINESDVCALFLEDAFPGEGYKLKPSDPGERSTLIETADPNCPITSAYGQG